MSDLMYNKIFVAYTLESNNDISRLFGTVSAFSKRPNYDTMIKISLTENFMGKIENTDFGLNIDMSLEDAEALLDRLNSTVNNIKQLNGLSKSGWLSEKFYKPDQSLAKEND